MAKIHPMSLVSLTFGSLAAGSAIYCIVDMSSPFSGVFQVSPAPIASVIEAAAADRELRECEPHHCGVPRT